MTVPDYFGLDHRSGQPRTVRTADLTVTPGSVGSAVRTYDRADRGGGRVYDQGHYFRRDQADGVTPPDLSKDSSPVDHIVRARGKRTNFTSVSLDPTKISIFGPTLYRLATAKVLEDGHVVIGHDNLMDELRKVAQQATRGEKTKAIQAQRYARMRQECLVNWNFDISRVDRKNLLTWAWQAIQQYFSKD